MEKLKIKAVSCSDLDMISAITQDSIILKNSIKFDGSMFSCLINRFCWEGLDNLEEKRMYRIHSALYFSGIKSVNYNKKFKEHENSKLLSLLTIHSDFTDNITIVFSDNSIIALKVSKIEVYLKDLYDHWPTDALPAHSI